MSQSPSKYFIMSNLCSNTVVVITFADYAQLDDISRFTGASFFPVDLTYDRKSTTKILKPRNILIIIRNIP